MIVITTCYGIAHTPYLMALLESLDRHNTHAFVVHDGAPETARVVSAYPYTSSILWPPASHVRTESAHKSTLAAFKVGAWAYGLTKVPDDCYVLFLDADILVLHDPLLFVSTCAALNSDWQVGITIRQGHRWPLNSGVLGLVTGTDTRVFTERWQEITSALTLSDHDVLTQLFGAVDQASLYLALAECGVSVVRLPSDRWNADQCSPVDHVVIAHLKGCLPYLLGRKQLGPGDERTDEACAPMFRAWREHYAAAQARVGGT